MKKKIPLLVGLVAAILVLVGLFFGIKYFNEEREKTGNETGIYVVKEDMDEIMFLSYDLNDQIYDFVKENGTWYCENDRTIALQQSQITRMLYNLAPLQAKSKLDDVLDLGEYGLNLPRQTIRLKTAQEEYVLNIGDPNDLTGDYYLQKQGDDSVYVVEAAISTTCNKRPDDLMEQADETAEGQEAGASVESGENAGSKQGVEFGENADSKKESQTKESKAKESSEQAQKTDTDQTAESQESKESTENQQTTESKESKESTETKQSEASKESTNPSTESKESSAESSQENIENNTDWSESPSEDESNWEDESVDPSNDFGSIM